MKITRRKLIWFEQMMNAIEERMTECANYIHRAKIPSNRSEEFSSIDVGNERFPGMTTSKKWIRSEYSYTTYPTECLYDNNALIRYREEKELSEQKIEDQRTENIRQQELKTLAALRDKYPERSI